MAVGLIFPASPPITGTRPSSTAKEISPATGLTQRPGRRKLSASPRAQGAVQTAGGQQVQQTQQQVHRTEIPCHALPGTAEKQQRKQQIDRRPSQIDHYQLQRRHKLHGRADNMNAKSRKVYRLYSCFCQQHSQKMAYLMQQDCQKGEQQHGTSLPTAYHCQQEEKGEPKAEAQPSDV